MTAWRRDLHAHPETAFEECRAADTVARLLASFGIEVEGGVARTGVIGILRGTEPRRRAMATLLAILKLFPAGHPYIRRG
jgi:hippurate hydrolase